MTTSGSPPLTPYFYNTSVATHRPTRGLGDNDDDTARESPTSVPRLWKK